MTHDDVPAAYETSGLAFTEGPEEERRFRERGPAEVEMRQGRFHHLIEHDPDGSWVAAEDGRVVGVALALRREGLWGLSLLTVDAAHRGTGVGKRLLGRALAYAAGCRSRITVSSTHPAAIRSYAGASLRLLPTLKASGVARREALPALPDVRDGEERDLDLAAEVDRRIRGAAHGPDLAVLAGSGRLLVSESSSGMGYAVAQAGAPALLAATHPEVAAKLLWACLAEGAGVVSETRWISADQGWAVPVVLAAGLELSPAGPVCVSGEIEPLTPYLPNGMFL